MNGSDPETRAATAAWIPLCSYARSRRIDQESQAAGLEETWLMGQAALSSAHAIRTDPDLLNAGTMHILCGPGNNGGDGLALAYMLIGMRHIIASIPALRIYQTGEARSSAAQFYAGLLREIAQSPIVVDVCLLPSSSFHFSAINNGDVIVDALLGTGQDRAPAGEIARLLAHVALARIRIACALLALDVPTGLREDRDTRFLNARELRHLVHRWLYEPPARNSDSPGTNPTRTESNAHPDDAIITGLLKLEIDRWLPAPDKIHSYGVMKLALELNRSLRMHSRVHVLPIGFHPTTPVFTSLVTESATRSDPSDPAVFAPSNYAAGQHTPGEDRLSRFLKSAWHHKYGAGHGLFIGGSIGMEGAALLACRSFFAAGGGILHGCVPASRSREFLTADFPATMFRILHTDNLRELTPRAVCIGPGLSPADAKAHAEVVHAYLTELMATHTQTTVLLDAGALSWLGRSDWRPLLQKYGQRILLTPHSGEWSRLGGGAPNSVRELQRNYELACQLGCHVLVKDSISVYFQGCESRTDDGVHVPVAVMGAPNARLAVAGSGDCLCGILLALLARRPDETTEQSISIARGIELAIELQSRAAHRYTHPTAADFPDGIRGVLAGVLEHRSRNA